MDGQTGSMSGWCCGQVTEHIFPCRYTRPCTTGVSCAAGSSKKNKLRGHESTAPVCNGALQAHKKKDTGTQERSFDWYQCGLSINWFLVIHWTWLWRLCLLFFTAMPLVTPVMQKITIKPHWHNVNEFMICLALLVDIKFLLDRFQKNIYGG